MCYNLWGTSPEHDTTVERDIVFFVISGFCISITEPNIGLKTFYFDLRFHHSVSAWLHHVWGTIFFVANMNTHTAVSSHNTFKFITNFGIKIIFIVYFFAYIIWISVLICSCDKIIDMVI